jgi:hypothetical protein
MSWVTVTDYWLNSSSARLIGWQKTYNKKKKKKNGGEEEGELTDNL